MGSRVRVPYAPQKLSRNSFELRESFCFWAEELSGQSESFPESCSCCSWIGTTKGSPLARFACKGADLIEFCEEVMIKHTHAPAYSLCPYLYGMMIYSEAG